MANVLMIVAQVGFRDEEFFVPKEILEKDGHIVKTASLTRGQAKGALGAIVSPDMAIYEANPEFFDCIVVVGGPGSPVLAKNKEVTELIEKGFRKGKIIAAICLGPMALAAAGILSGRNATVFKSREGLDALYNGGATYKDKGVIVDENIITADSPQNAERFGIAIAEKLR
ncbi:DJ-1/PfpI family protein [Candidatus Micrarchaeota archaeon]|nr:DJ-1/PfpI family protein [Candidatus Micrarchaeota archaeon]